MPKLGYGLTAGTKAALRISFDNTVDLINEPTSSMGKFQFDSLQGTSIGYVYEIFDLGYDSRFRQTGAYQGNFWFFDGNVHDLNTPMSNANHYFDCGALIYWNNVSDGAQIYYFFDSWWPFGYLPIMEWRQIDPDLPANTFKGAVVDYNQFQVSGSGYVMSNAGYTSTTEGVNYNLGNDHNNYLDLRDGYRLNTRTDVGDHADTFSYLCSVLQVPARDGVMPDFSTTPASGQDVLLLTPNVARLALPGRDVGDSDLNHFIFHENKIPAKIMRAGDINVAGNGSVDLICPLPLTPLTYMDFMIKRQSESTFWNPPYFDSISSDKSLSFTYEVKADRISITNGTSTAITIRFMIFADSEEAHTTGGKQVLRRANDGVRDFIQIKRPGSSDTSPNLNDIIIDTRLAYVPILAQGYLPWSSGFPIAISGSERFKGERMVSILVNNPSPKLKLFPKQAVVFPSRATTGLTNGHHRVFTDSGTWTGRCSQNSSWANVYSDESGVDFFMAGSNPLNLDGSGSANYVRVPTSVGGSNVNAIGMSYVIFGIPQSL